MYCGVIVFGFLSLVLACSGSSPDALDSVLANAAQATLVPAAPDLGCTNASFTNLHTLTVEHSLVCASPEGMYQRANIIVS